MVKRLVRLRNYLVYKFYDISASITRKTFPTNSSANFIVSIASYPKRDPLLPAVFQALSNQTCPPLKYVLVLSEEDYDNREIPSHLKKLEKKGVEIIWNRNNPYAVKKLVPVVEKYAELAVVTLDDDFIYHKNLLENLINNKYVKEGCIVGHVGKAMYRKGNEVKMMYRTPKKVDESTPPEEIYFLGGWGTYYPPNSLHSKFKDIGKINEIIPGRGSDFWFWAAAIANGTKQVCIGIPDSFRLGIPIPQNEQTKPRDLPGRNIVEQRFQKTIDYFEIRDKLIEILPDKNDI
ncbi:hypothetical protein CYPRO_2450 [Cyclonatronum proteinivorum]|uniref:Glycosyl transferase family 2 n=1 Tax=Cyclonatronum proteinivorum TaxID=1457365 RepID=A0A345UMJ0_9BACT|nr:glycosyltransferase [Cyclonatronum proteinivorum]AXJ01692.1 hypothetical protein CYPRO_2450 [Cyclonatronum proteinivorum]